MIDWQRVLDSPAFFAVAVGVALLVGGVAGYGLSIALRTVTARHLAEKWFGDIQKEVVKLNGILSQNKMTITDQESKIARARGRIRATLDDLEE